ncbi:kinase-like domain-containing protein [Zopfochytrium polystomum]|nr:kinase-like domain-containing protein [Zopfochytrium polystomum]
MPEGIERNDIDGWSDFLESRKRTDSSRSLLELYAEATSRYLDEKQPPLMHVIPGAYSIVVALIIIRLLDIWLDFLNLQKVENSNYVEIRDHYKFLKSRMGCRSSRLYRQWAEFEDEQGHRDKAISILKSGVQTAGPSDPLRELLARLERGETIGCSFDHNPAPLGPPAPQQYKKPHSDPFRMKFPGPLRTTTRTDAAPDLATTTPSMLALPLPLPAQPYSAPAPALDAPQSLPAPSNAESVPHHIMSQYAATPLRSPPLIAVPPLRSRSGSTIPRPNASTKESLIVSAPFAATIAATASAPPAAPVKASARCPVLPAVAAAAGTGRRPNSSFFTATRRAAATSATAAPVATRGRKTMEPGATVSLSVDETKREVTSAQMLRSVDSVSDSSLQKGSQLGDDCDRVISLSEGTRLNDTQPSSWSRGDPSARERKHLFDSSKETTQANAVGTSANSPGEPHHPATSPQPRPPPIDTYPNRCLRQPLATITAPAQQSLPSSEEPLGGARPACPSKIGDVSMVACTPVVGGAFVFDQPHHSLQNLQQHERRLLHPPPPPLPVSHQSIPLAMAPTPTLTAAAPVGVGLYSGSFAPTPLAVLNSNAAGVLVAGTPMGGGGDAKAGLEPRLNTRLTVNGKPYNLISLIGRGGSSKVYKVMAESSLQTFALKKVKLDWDDPATTDGYLNEVRLLRNLAGTDHIIGLIDAEVVDSFLYVVLEFGEISLQQLLVKDAGRKIGDMNFVRLMWSQMLKAVQCIHDENIIHSDLKPANFMLVEGTLKLIDFGIARSIPNDTTNVHRDSQNGTINYMAPETFIEEDSDSAGASWKIGRSSDVWSLGCILYQLVYGRTPFSHLAPNRRRIAAITDPTHVILFPPPPLVSSLTTTPSIETVIPVELAKKFVDPSIIAAMKGCLVFEPKGRMTIPQLLTHKSLHSCGVCIEDLVFVIDAARREGRKTEDLAKELFQRLFEV